MLLRVPSPAQLPKAFDLSLERRLRHAERLDLRLFVDDEIVDADDDPLFVLDFPLVPIRGVRDFLLEEPFPNRGDHAPEFRNPVEVAVCFRLQLVRQRFEEVGAAERVDRIGHPALMRENLLGPQRNSRGPLVRNLVRLVEGVCVEGLSAPEDCGERLDRRSDDVHLRLLRGQAHARRLGVEPQTHRPRFLGTDRVAHLARPDATRRAIFRELLEEIVMGVEEKRKAWREVVDSQTAVDAPADVLHPVREGEREFLGRGRARLADVIPADRNRVPLGNVFRAELERVHDEPHRRLGSSAPPNRANIRIVHSRPRYMVGWMPRVNGKPPGLPSRSSAFPATSSGVYNLLTGRPEVVMNSLRRSGSASSASRRVVSCHRFNSSSRTFRSSSCRMNALRAFNWPDAIRRLWPLTGRSSTRRSSWRALGRLARRSRRSSRTCRGPGTRTQAAWTKPPPWSLPGGRRGPSCFRARRPERVPRSREPRRSTSSGLGAIGRGSRRTPRGRLSLRGSRPP